MTVADLLTTCLMIFPPVCDAIEKPIILVQFCDLSSWSSVGESFWRMFSAYKQLHNYPELHHALLRCFWLYCWPEFFTPTHCRALCVCRPIWWMWVHNLYFLYSHITSRLIKRKCLPLYHYNCSSCLCSVITKIICVSHLWS